MTTEMPQMTVLPEVLSWDAPREQWLEARRTGIGSSDIAGVLGQSSWATPYSVWWSKVGPVEDRIGAGPPAELMRWGNLLEPVIAQAWADDHHAEVSRVGLCRSVDRPWQMATPDRVTDDGGVLECKTALPWDVSEWDTDRVPLKYLLQVTQQMDVLGFDHGYMPVLIGGSDFRCYEVPFDPTIAKVIRDAGEQFWKLVESNTAPPVDGHKSTTVALKSRYNVADNVTASLDWTWHDRVGRREQLDAEMDRLKKAKDAIDNELREALGAATHGVCGGQVIATWKPRKDGVRVINVIDSTKRRDISA